MKKEYRFKFSIVTAVYNVEAYLEEAIQSILHQDIGFEDSIEIILVNDGSTDNSGKICDSYQKKYPNNIKVIHKENGGVSSARNEGLKHIEGRYVNFMDPDDMLTKDTLSRVYDYFNKVDNEVDLVSIPEEYFERHTGPHPLNYKYASGKNEIIDMWTQYSYIQMSMASSFIKNSAVTDIQLDTSLKYAEDAKFVMEILFHKCRFGVVPKAKYRYRLRNTENSALSTSKAQKGWYLDYLKYYTHWAIRESLRKFGFVPKFVQYNIMYDMQWRFRVSEVPKDVLTSEEQKEFVSLLASAVNYVSDGIIFEQKRLSRELKDYIIGLKKSSGTGIQEFFDEDARIRYNDTATHRLSSYPAKLEKLYFIQDHIVLEGILIKNAKFQQDFKFFATISSQGKETDLVCEFHDAPERASKFFGTVLAHAIAFKIQVPVSAVHGLSYLNIYAAYGSHVVRCRNQVSEEGFPISGDFKQAYFYQNKYIVRLPSKNITIEPAVFIKHLKKEIRYCREALKGDHGETSKCAFLRKRIKLLFLH